MLRNIQIQFFCFAAFYLHIPCINWVVGVRGGGGVCVFFAIHLNIDVNKLFTFIAISCESFFLFTIVFLFVCPFEFPFSFFSMFLIDYNKFFSTNLIYSMCLFDSFHNNLPSYSWIEIFICYKEESNSIWML